MDIIKLLNLGYRIIHRQPSIYNNFDSNMNLPASLTLSLLHKEMPCKTTLKDLKFDISLDNQNEKIEISFGQYKIELTPAEFDTFISCLQKLQDTINHGFK